MGEPPEAQPPEPDPAPRAEPGHGIEDEPHLRCTRAQADPSERAAEEAIRREEARGGQAQQRAVQSVFEEPFTVCRPDRAGQIIDHDYACARCGYNLRGHPFDAPCPECGHRETSSYRQWLTVAQASVSAGQGWFVTVAVALLGGPFAVLGALWSSGGSLALIVFGPTAEEILKIGAIVMVVETRPHLLRRGSQIVLAALGSALGFAVIENLLYLNVYVRDPSALLVTWRWTVCTALHVGCTAIAVQGVLRVWRRTVREFRPPDVAPVLPWLVAAIILHGTYNALAIVLEATGLGF